LTSLKECYIDKNELVDSIPPELGNMNSLLYLSFNENYLEGTIPVELFNLKNLQILSLSSNQLNGGIPHEIGNLSNLTQLSLVFNQLKDNIPESITRLTNLQHLDLAGNQLTGPIPPALGSLKNLQVLNLNSNELEGCFPESLLKLCTIPTITFSDNTNLPNGGDISTFCNDKLGVCTDPVWPGDFNNDGIADNTDALYWGLACKETLGPIRLNATTNWIGQEATDWGVGVIDENDLQILIDNYGKTHGYESFNEITNGITYNLVPNTIGGDTLKIDLNLSADGIPIELHGMACSIDFGSLPIESVYLDTTNSSLNPDRSIMLFDSTANLLDIALTRIDKTDILCDGSLGTLWIIIADAMDLGDEVYIEVANGSKMLANGDFSAVGSASLYSTYSLEASPDNMILSVSSSPVECDKLGSAIVNIAGGEAPYTIQWNNGATTATIKNLLEGEYTVSVSDANGLNSSYQVIIEGQYIPEYDENGELVDCNPENCQPTLDIINVIPGGIHQASNTITTNGVLSIGTDAILKAGQSIVFQPGFMVESEGTLLAEIEDCTISSLDNTINSTAYKVISKDIHVDVNQKQNSPIISKEPIINIYPNPTDGQAVIVYDLPATSEIQLSLSTLSGTQIHLFKEEVFEEAGKYQIELTTKDLAKGIYIVSLQTAERVVTKKLIVL